MKLTFKDLKQQKFTLEAEPSETIGQVKAKIEAEKGWEVSSQKLIYSGKILKDEETIESYKIEEKGFIVYMVNRPKAAPAPAPAASSSTPVAEPPSTPAVASTPAAPPALPQAASGSTGAVPATPTPAQGITTTESAGFNDPNALATGGARAAAIANMESMGFPRADIDRAMRAAFNNPDRAVEYLLNGIPASARDNAQPPPAAPAGAAAAAAAPTTTTTAQTTTAATNPSNPEDTDAPINLFEAAAQAGRSGGSTRSGGATRGTGASAAAATPAGLEEDLATATSTGNLAFLRDNPYFQTLRQMVQTQPNMLEPILQQVGAGNPQLARLISENSEQFLELLAEDASEDAPLPASSYSISVTEEEREAIERLCRLGFSRDLAIQAYFACDKNEDLAANFLFDLAPDEDEN